MARQLLQAPELASLLNLLRDEGRIVVGPVPRDGAVALEALESLADLPRGMRDVQDPGHFRLESTGSSRFFDVTLGPQSPRRWMQPPRELLFRARSSDEGFQVERPEPPPKLALIGARACDLAALAISDRVFRGTFEDPRYASRREGLFVVAVQCGRAASTCFCASMDTGPRVAQGFDLCLTELDDEAGHRFLVEVGSAAGQALLDRLPTTPPGADADAPEQAANRAEGQMSRRLGTEGLRERLLAALEGPHWDEVATRCLGCANCTMVCPTCFCSTVDDITTLDGAHERVRRWDSCFNPDHSYVHGHGPVRASLGDRYRQWLTHKLATWHDQFDSSGCVGCGRCIAWCPAGIDLVAEAERAGSTT